MQDTNLSENPNPQGASPTSRSTRRVLTTTGAIAAVVLVAILAALFFHGVFGRSGPTGPDPQLELTSISMISASEGWAVGGQDWNPSRNDDGSGTTVLYHYKNRAVVSDLHPHQRSRHLRWIASCAADRLYGLGDGRLGRRLI